MVFLHHFLRGTMSEESQLGLIHIYSGNGKGKTTASLGLISRFLGYEKKVLFVQFMKKPQTQFDQYGEIKFFSNNPHFEYQQFGAVDWVIKGKPTEKAISEAFTALQFLKEKLETAHYDLVVADELLYCLDMELFQEKDVLSVIASKPEHTELVITGSHKKWPKIYDYADYVSFTEKIKHPFDKGIQARKIVEY
jgi:cob(I)alamin adenosyltransferase